MIRSHAVLLLPFVACARERTPAATEASSQAAKEALEPLTVSAIMSTKGIVKQDDPWVATVAKLRTILGDPMVVEDDVQYWAALSGETCALVLIGKEGHDPNERVGWTHGPDMYGADSHKPERGQCREIAGVAAVEPDPTATPPDPAALLTVAALYESAFRGRTSWAGRQVTVSATMSDANHKRAYLVGDDLGLVCRGSGATWLANGTELLGTTRTFTGKVRVDTMRGNRLRLSLYDCNIVP